MAKRKRSKKAASSTDNVVKKVTTKKKNALSTLKKPKVKSKSAGKKKTAKTRDPKKSFRIVGSLKGFVGRHGQFRGPQSSLRETLALYGIGVGDFKSRAKQLEKVIQDIRNQDFLRNPNIQSLMKKVQKQPTPQATVEVKSELAAQKPIASKVEEAKEEFFRAQVLSDESKKELGRSLVKSILSRVDEFRKSMTPSVPSMTMLGLRKKKKKI